MATKITLDTIESFLNCKYKGFLKLTGENGTKSDYETMVTAERTSDRKQVLTRLAARFGEGNPRRGTTATVAGLEQGEPLLVDVVLEDELISLRFDSLKRTQGRARLLTVSGGQSIVRQTSQLADRYAGIEGRLAFHGRAGLPR